MTAGKSASDFVSVLPGDFSYMSKRLPYFSRTCALPDANGVGEVEIDTLAAGPTPRPSSQTS